MRIAVFATYRKFLEDIVLELDKKDEYDVLCFKGGSITDIMALLSWCDVAWVDWCDQLLIEITKLPKTKPIIARVHSYEVFTELPKKVNWSKVDCVVFVNSIVQELFDKMTDGTVSSKRLIPNGVNLEKFTIPKNKQYGNKIGYVGGINYKKNPILALQCFRDIHVYNREYSFHVAGNFEDSRIKMYWDYFVDRYGLPVLHDGYVEDMPAWYADKDYILSTSIFESFQYGVAEGIACGLMPLIHQWPGAEKIYWPAVTFCMPHECVRLCKTYKKKDKTEMAQVFRKHIAKNYDLKDQMSEIEYLLQQVVA